MDEFSRNGEVLEDILFITLHDIAIIIQTGYLQYTHRPQKVDVGYTGYTLSVRLSVVGFSICLFVYKVSGAYRTKYWPSSFVTWYTHLVYTHIMSLLTDPIDFCLDWVFFCPLVGQNTVKGNGGDNNLGFPSTPFPEFTEKKYQLNGFITQYAHLYNESLDA